MFFKVLMRQVGVTHRRYISPFLMAIPPLFLLILLEKNNKEDQWCFNQKHSFIDVIFFFFPLFDKDY